MYIQGLSVGVPLLAGQLVGLASFPNILNWYLPKVRKPSWTPPVWLFGPAWCVCSALVYSSLVSQLSATIHWCALPSAAVQLQASIQSTPAAFCTISRQTIASAPQPPGKLHNALQGGYRSLPLTGGLPHMHAGTPWAQGHACCSYHQLACGAQVSLQS